MTKMMVPHCAGDDEAGMWRGGGGGWRNGV
jgi:hypothetical protein